MNNPHDDLTPPHAGTPPLPDVDDKPDLVAIYILGFGEFRIGIKGVAGLAFATEETGLNMEIIVLYKERPLRRFVAPVLSVTKEFRDKVIAVPKTGAAALVVPGR